MKSLRARRAMVFAYDACALVLLAFLLSFAFVRPAWAYIDPSVMTYTIQAVAGVVVALSAVAGVALRRGRKKITKLLDLDESKKHVYEEQVYRLSEDGTPLKMDAQYGDADEAADPNSPERVAAVMEAAAAAAEKAAIEHSPDPAKAARKIEKQKQRAARRVYAPKWRERFLVALLVSAFTVCTVFVVAPYEVVANAAGDLVFTLGDVWWVAALPALGFIVGGALAISIARGRAFIAILVVGFSIGLAAYVQALFMNVGMPIADGETLVWSDHNDMIIISGVVWILILAVPFVLSFFNRFRAQGIVCLLSAALLIVQGVGVASLIISPPEAVVTGGADTLQTQVTQPTEIAMTEDGLFTVSDKENVIVFVLDTYDVRGIQQNLRNDRGLLDEMTGFTIFYNSSGSMIPTRFAVPYLLTAQLPQYDEKFSTYKEERYPRSSFISDIYDTGYSIGIYSDSMAIGNMPESEQEKITSKTINMHELTASTMDYGGTLSALFQIGLYRDAPWCFKYLFWYYTDAINDKIVRYNPDAEPGENVYIMDDLRFYEQLQQRQLTIEDGEHPGAFRFIHLLGAHYPFSYDENAEFIGVDESTQEQQSRGAMKIVSEYLAQMKALGVYDDATIIITADHGTWWLRTEPLDRASCPIMLVKPAQSSEAASEPIKTSLAPVSHLDLPATIIDALGRDASGYGDTIWVASLDENRVRRYLTTDSEGLQDVAIREYEITGNALNIENWHLTGQMWDSQE